MVVVCAWCGTTLDDAGSPCPSCVAAGDEHALASPGVVRFAERGPVCPRHGAILTAAAMGGVNEPNLRRAAAALAERPS